MKKFEWQDFYEELADKLLAYRDDHALLLQKVACAHEMARLNFPEKIKDWVVDDIDPFSVFALINKKATEENKSALQQAMKDVFSVSANAPKDFSGIPHSFNMNPWFFQPGRDVRQHINGLWDMFEAAIKYAAGKCGRDEFCDQYNRVRSQKGVKRNLTMGLFWIRPDFYVNLDACNTQFIFESGNFALNFANKFRSLSRGCAAGESYLTFCEELKKEISSDVSHFDSIAQLSHKAYEWMVANEENINSKQRVRFYKIGCHPDDVRYDLSFEWCRDGEIALGWNYIGDIEKRFRRKDGCYDEARIAKALNGKSSGSDTRSAREIIRFMEADANVVFVVMRGFELVGLVDNVGPYQYKKRLAEAGRFAHCRSGVWHKCFKHGERLPVQSECMRRTCVELENKENIDFLLRRYRKSRLAAFSRKPEAARIINRTAILASLEKQLRKVVKTDRRCESLQRIGQAELRKYLLSCEGKCPITGISTPELLVASHIKAWSESSVKEKIDTENVLLLAKNYDAAFDNHLITFDPDNGAIIKAERISWHELDMLGIKSDVALPQPTITQSRYLKHHLRILKIKDMEFKSEHSV